MQRHLLFGTALVAASMLAAGGAVAQDKMKMSKPAISINGGYDALIGGVLNEERNRPGGDETPDTTGLDVRSDVEIHFNGRATTDNGLKVHARVELEGANHHSQDNDNGAGGDPIDEYFLSVSGSFGQLIFGGTGGAPVKMLTGLSGSWATGVGETLSFDVNDWVPNAAAVSPDLSGGQAHYTLQHSRLDTGDAEKITYISPKFGGFQVGMTYSPNRKNNDDNTRPVTTDSHDGFEGAASYSGKFGGVSFGVGAGMTSYQGGDGVTDGGKSDWLVAGRLDFGGGFRVAVAHKQVTDDNEASQGQLTDVGVRYVMGANSFSVTGVLGETDQGQASYRTFMGSYARAMGPGMKVHLNLIGTDSESRDGNADNSGLIAVTGVKVSF